MRASTSRKGRSPVKTAPKPAPTSKAVIQQFWSPYSSKGQTYRVVQETRR